MCFDNHSPDISKIAEKNMTVYKCMTFDSKSKLVISPYLEGFYTMNELNTAPYCSLKDYGGFYSFKTLKSCIRWRKRNFIFTKKDERIYKIFKCIIPKGTRYLQGYFELSINLSNDNYRCYNATAFRSKKIIFKERIIER
jgi:hypothetical protein